MKNLFGYMINLKKMKITLALLLVYIYYKFITYNYIVNFRFLQIQSMILICIDNTLKYSYLFSFKKMIIHYMLTKYLNTKLISNF